MATSSHLASTVGSWVLLTTVYNYCSKTTTYPIPTGYPSCLNYKIMGDASGFLDKKAYKAGAISVEVIYWPSLCVPHFQVFSGFSEKNSFRIISKRLHLDNDDITSYG